MGTLHKHPEREPPTLFWSMISSRIVLATIFPTERMYANIFASDVPRYLSSKSNLMGNNVPRDYKPQKVMKFLLFAATSGNGEFPFVTAYAELYPSYLIKVPEPYL